MWTQLLGMAINAMAGQKKGKEGGGDYGEGQAKALTEGASSTFGSEMDQLAQGGGVGDNLRQAQQNDPGNVLYGPDGMPNGNAQLAPTADGSVLPPNNYAEVPMISPVAPMGGRESQPNEQDNSASWPIMDKLRQKMSATEQSMMNQGQQFAPLQAGQSEMNDPSTGKPWDTSGAPRALDANTGRTAAMPNGDWGNVIPFSQGPGTGRNPNALVRAGVGYNQGGLVGALGYLLSDLSEQNNRKPTNY